MRFVTLLFFTFLSYSLRAQTAQNQSASSISVVQLSKLNGYKLYLCSSAQNDSNGFPGFNPTYIMINVTLYSASSNIACEVLTDDKNSIRLDKRYLNKFLKAQGVKRGSKARYIPYSEVIGVLEESTAQGSAEKVRVFKIIDAL